MLNVCRTHEKRPLVDLGVYMIIILTQIPIKEIGCEFGYFFNWLCVGSMS
jgi:hypothetical protein